MSTLEEKFINTFSLGDNEDKYNAVFNTEGPTLIIAGPGTGKTYTLVLRTLYLILSGRAKPSEIVLTTFTEKSAFELRDRLSSFAKNRLNSYLLLTYAEEAVIERVKKIAVNLIQLGMDFEKVVEIARLDVEVIKNLTVQDE
ncbi:hypothetical protein FACS1894130_05130 [Spirochaetia bacterium]|nr:hypothetical protein FACS1894130_05130 [Spirochaetia bacterium]